MEPDPTTAQHLMSALHAGDATRGAVPLSRVVGSLRELHRLDLTGWELVICSTMLRDGSGLDALAYLRGIAPRLPVILIGCDASIAVEAIRGGAIDYLLLNENDLAGLALSIEKSLVHHRIRMENDRLNDELRRSLAELECTNVQLQQVVQQLEAMARTDELTGLWNRRWFNLMLAGNWAEAQRYDQPLACLMIDLDGFKVVNDRMGHIHGDEMLRLAAMVIRSNCRETDVPSRFGGDEFCVLMPHTQPHEAVLVANRILREFERVMRGRPSTEPPLGMSIGISHLHVTQPDHQDHLVNHADEAMYAAKSAGKQQVVIRTPAGFESVGVSQRLSLLIT